MNGPEVVAEIAGTLMIVYGIHRWLQGVRARNVVRWELVPLSAVKIVARPQFIDGVKEGWV